MGVDYRMRGMTKEKQISYPNRLSILVALLVITQTMNGCYFFRKKDTGQSLSENTETVLGNPLGPKAGGPIYSRLDEIYAVTTDEEPAAIRLDPDTYVRQLLLQYRPQGSTVARQIGRVEEYRLLLGGANEDFSKEPQKTYDATSLLAQLKVASEVCTGLVAPNAQDHPGWNSILPAPPSDKDTNIRFLAQRFLGIHSNDISDTTIDQLKEILDQASSGASPNHSHYVSVCTTLALDASSLLL